MAHNRHAVYIRTNVRTYVRMPVDTEVHVHYMSLHIMNVQGRA